MQRILDFLQQAGFYFLATVEGDAPRIRPFGSSILYDGRLYICMGDFKKVYAQLMANPKVAIGAMGAEGKWMRLTGELVFDDSPEPKEAMYEALPSLHEIYDGQDYELKLAWVANGHAEFCGVPGETEEFDF